MSHLLVRRIREAQDARNWAKRQQKAPASKRKRGLGELVYSHSMALFLSSRHSSCTQFSVPSRDECRQVTPCRVSSASGTKAGTTPKTFFKLKGIEFLFLSQRARRTAFGGSISPKTPVLKLNRPLACKPPASTASESALVVFEPFAKPQVTGLWYRWAK